MPFIPYTVRAKQPRGVQAQGAVVRTFKIFLVLVLLGAAGLVAFAYLGDLSPEQSEARIPVDLDGS